MSTSQQRRPMMLMVVVAVVMHLTSGHLVEEEKNLLLNPSFENLEQVVWTENGELLFNVSDLEKLDGNYSLLCLNRESANSGPSQILKGLHKGGEYELKAYVLLANDVAGPLGQPLKAVVRFYEDGENDTTGDDGTSNSTYVIASRSLVTTKQRWVLLSGLINAPMTPFTSARLFIYGPDPKVDFYVDNVTFHEVPKRSDWLAQSHVMIDKHRKRNIFFRVYRPENVDPNSVDIQVRLRRHRFAFGCKFPEKLMRKSSEKYLNKFYNLFNWVALTDFDLAKKPKENHQKNKTNRKRKPIQAHYNVTIDVFNNEQMKVWAQPSIKGPKHGSRKDNAGLPESLKYMLNITKKRIEVLDLQSKLILGKSKNPKALMALFKLVRAVDPSLKLFLNDFNVGSNDEDYHDLARKFTKAESGISGLGLKEHFKSLVSPDLIWRRLNRLDDAGLDLFISELDLTWPNEVERADWFENIMRAYFAHPAVQGVILNGIWQQLQKDPNRNLVYGENLKFSEEGERFVCLTRKEWWVDQTFNIAKHGLNFNMRGFQGDYEIIVRKNLVPMQQKTFTLGREDETVNIEITEDSSAVLPEEIPDFVPKCISHRNLKTFGTVTSNSNDSAITCSDHMSEASATEVKVTCPEGTVMTSCRSFKNESGPLKWIGERITVENGIAACSAEKHGNSSLEGVKVFARCCGGTGLTCDYWHAGPSSPFHGAMAEASCPAGQLAMGCTAYNRNSHIKGSYPSSDMSSCVAETGLPLTSNPALLTGVVSGVACCSRSTGMHCQQVKSEASKSGLTAMVACPEGEIMTECNLEAEDGSDAGARVLEGPEGSTFCKAEVGEHLRTPVKATAICCAP